MVVCFVEDGVKVGYVVKMNCWLMGWYSGGMSWGGEECD